MSSGGKWDEMVELARAPSAADAATRRDPPKPTTVVVVRHGETEWNADARWQGQTDVGLSARGIAGATRLGHRVAADPAFAGLTAVYSSDLIRAADTARHIVSAAGLPASVLRGPDPRLREMAFGRLEGKTPADTMQDPACAAFLKVGGASRRALESGRFVSHH